MALKRGNIVAKIYLSLYPVIEFLKTHKSHFQGKWVRIRYCVRRGERTSNADCIEIGIYMRKAVRFLLKQGHLQPHFHSEARTLSTQLQKGLLALKAFHNL